MPIYNRLVGIYQQLHVYVKFVHLYTYIGSYLITEKFTGGVQLLYNYNIHTHVRTLDA